MRFVLSAAYYVGGEEYKKKLIICEKIMGLVNGETLKNMKKGEEISAPGFRLGFWLMGDYNDQDNPYYDESDGSSCFVICEADAALEEVESQIKELQKTKRVKEIIFPEVDYGPEVRVNIVDYPKSVTFKRTS